MGKQKKLKYKDIVGKTKEKKFKSKPKFNKKTKKSTKTKRRYIFPKSDPTTEATNESQSFMDEASSSSDEENVDLLKNLRETLGIENSFDSEESDSEVEKNSDDEPMEHSYSDQESVLSEENTKNLNTVLKQEEEIENVEDPFVKHVTYEVNNLILKSLQETPPKIKTTSKTWKSLGDIIIHIPFTENIITDNNHFNIEEKKVYAEPANPPVKADLKVCKPADLFIKPQLELNLTKANSSLGSTSEFFLTSLQNELFSIVNNYQDLWYPEETLNNADEIRFVYCLHAMNHVLKTRTKVLHHNGKLSKKDEVPDSFRDQGLVRPKVLFILPFKNTAYKVINKLIDLLISIDKGNVMNKKRFQEEFTGNEIKFPKKNPKPEDYEQLFAGNSSDDFKIGLSVTKNTLKLYSDFYSADIIVASPLGLRTVIGADGESNRDFDFLASIELLILDQTEIFLMQNWDHLIHVFNHLHLQPKESHGTDFSRVRTWSLDGLAKYYRQTLIFSSVSLPEINSIFNKKCKNYRGKVKVSNPITTGTISHVMVQLPHVFYRFDAKDALQSIDARFEFFLAKVLPQQRDALMKQTVIYLPNYFDYVRLRNYFKKEDVSFKQVCEYSKTGKVARARDMFYHGDAHFLLYTERYHFYNRVRLKAIRHLVFYQPPNFPNFYYELCNLMQETNMNRRIGSMSNMTITVVYSKYDAHQLAAIVGTERATKMLSSENNVHMMVTGGD